MRACKIIASRSCADAPPALRSTLHRGVAFTTTRGRWPKPVGRRREQLRGPARCKTRATARYCSSARRTTTAPFNDVHSDVDRALSISRDKETRMVLINKLRARRFRVHAALLNAGGSFWRIFLRSVARAGTFAVGPIKERTDRGSVSRAPIVLSRGGFIIVVGSRGNSADLPRIVIVSGIAPRYSVRMRGPVKC